VKKLTALILILLITLLCSITAFADTERWHGVSLRDPVLGSNVATSNRATIDYSNANEGYILVTYTGNAPNGIFIRVRQEGRWLGKQNFDGIVYMILSNASEPITIVLSEGDGRYIICIHRIDRNNDERLLTATFDVELRHELLPFLQPNYFVNFTPDGAVAELAETLSREAPKETTRAIFFYVSREIRYDFELARTITYGYVPNLEELVTQTRRGICFDFASLMTALLRLNDIPAKMVFGHHEESNWHAWVEVYLPDYGWAIFDPTKRIGDDRILNELPIVGRTIFNASDFSPVQFY
jgi:transglutaminase-like putative cysteine protease